MSVQNRKIILFTYSAISVIIILSLIFIAFGPFWHRNVLELSQQTIPPKWNEYVSSYLQFLLVPAIYGVFAVFIRNKPNLVRGYFIGASIIGMIFSWVAWIFGSFARADCNNNCAPYIFSYHAFHLIALFTLPLSLVAPITLLLYFWKSKT
jgi:hypothetical protein